MPSEGFVKDFDWAYRASATFRPNHRPHADGLVNRFVKNRLAKAESTAEIKAANWAKNEFEVRYPPMSSIAYRLRTNPPCSAGKTVAPTTSPVLYRYPHHGQDRGREPRNNRKTKTRSSRGGCITVYAASFFRFRPTARPRGQCSWNPSARNAVRGPAADAPDQSRGPPGAPVPLPGGAAQARGLVV